MPVRYVAVGVIGLLAIIGWNVFLIQRDNKLFDAYDARMEQIRQAENQ